MIYLNWITSINLTDTLEYNVCDDTCESDLNDHFGKIFPDCKYHSANEFNTCNSNPLCLPGVSFIHLNARSLNSNFRQIEDYLKSLDYTFDVIAVSETWMSHNSNNFNIPGYDAYITLSEKIRKVEAWPVMLNRNLHPSV